MSEEKEIVKGVPIGNLLYTTEGKESRERAKAELGIPDPPLEKVLGVLNHSESEEDEQEVD